MNKATFYQLIEEYRKAYNFDKPLGVLAKSNLIMQFKKTIANHANLHQILLKLKKCDTINQMLGVLAEETDYLSQLRTPDELENLETQIHRIIKFAQIPTL